MAGGAPNERKGFAGLDCLVSDISDVTTSQAAPATVQPSPSAKATGAPAAADISPENAARPQRPTTPVHTGSPSPNSRGGRWILAGIAVIAVGWWISSSSGTRHPPSQVPSVPSTVVPAIPPEPNAFTEQVPTAGVDRVLTLEQVRYCLAQDIRLTAARSVVNAYSHADIDRFNAMINSYNASCGRFRYYPGTLERARGDVESRRSALEAEGRRFFVPSSSATQQFPSRFDSTGAAASTSRISPPAIDPDLAAVLQELTAQSRSSASPEAQVEQPRSSQELDLNKILQKLRSQRFGAFGAVVRRGQSLVIKADRDGRDVQVVVDPRTGTVLSVE